MKKTMCELFAGVGGFRLGFDRLKKGWETVWFSQWEPDAKTQYAHECYVRHFGDSLDLAGEYTTGIDIAKVDKNNIPDHTLLVGGFPCQDYSVAHSLSKEKGIEGKKGVLWWEIYKTLQAKNPPFCLFENVDRLVKSPAKQRGRDFGIMLACLDEQGYDVEWRVVNAAEYGAGQRRKRTFIFCYKRTTKYHESVCNHSPEKIFLKEGMFAKTLPVVSIGDITECDLPKDVFEISNKFKFNFENAGYMKDGTVFTTTAVAKTEEPITLGSLLEKDVDDSFVVRGEKLEKWRYLKGAKKIERTDANGYKYTYSEGAIAFPDHLDRPARTMLTSEGTVNRSSHLVLDPQSNEYRIITPVEAERIQGFDDNWTEGMTRRMRYFTMGNALVVAMITRMGKYITKIIEKED